MSRLTANLTYEDLGIYCYHGTLKKVQTFANISNNQFFCLIKWAVTCNTKENN